MSGSRDSQKQMLLQIQGESHNGGNVHEHSGHPAETVSGDRETASELGVGSEPKHKVQ